jgi:hypothetical protein
LTHGTTIDESPSTVSNENGVCCRSDDIAADLRTGLSTSTQESHWAHAPAPSRYRGNGACESLSEDGRVMVFPKYANIRVRCWSGHVISPPAANGSLLPHLVRH